MDKEIIRKVLNEYVNESSTNITAGLYNGPMEIGAKKWKNSELGPFTEFVDNKHNKSQIKKNNKKKILKEPLGFGKKIIMGHILLKLRMFIRLMRIWVFGLVQRRNLRVLNNLKALGLIFVEKLTVSIHHVVDLIQIRVDILNVEPQELLVK